MKQKKYGVALIGCGVMGEAHLSDIYCRDNVELKVICDLDEERARYMQKKYGAQRIETNYINVTEADDVDIVIIATYPSTHLEILKKCLANGKHVVCEKPISHNLENGREMVELIKAHPETKVIIGYILRHNKTFQKAAEMVRSGAIGFPIIMRMTQNHHTMDWNKYLKLIEDTSPIVDCGVHYLDIMQWFTGAKVTEVSGIGLKTESDVSEGKYNYGLLTAKLSDGSIGYYEAGWGNTMSSNNLKEFVGPKGRIQITLQMFRSENTEEGDLIEYYKYPEKTYEMININCNRKPTGDQLQMLIDMIEKDIPASPTIDEVWESFCMAIKADEEIKKQL